jgi:septin family protein
VVNLLVFISFIFKATMPFAVVGSNATIEVQGKKVRGRRYPWGVVEGQTKRTSLKNLHAEFSCNIFVSFFM